jgi:hypothetical protein
MRSECGISREAHLSGLIDRAGVQKGEPALFWLEFGLTRLLRTSAAASVISVATKSHAALQVRLMVRGC